MNQSIGFIGLGSMGEPMALNMMRNGHRLLVWNRNAERTKPLAHAGAQVAADAGDVFRRCRVVFLMLADGDAIDAVLDRTGDDFERRVRDHVIVHMGTTAAKYSQELEADICASGGSYVEAPVSGSRKPAENGELVAMLAGETDAVNEVAPLCASMCRRVFKCGAVPHALNMKFAVNLLLIGMVTSLAEAFHLAERQGLDLNALTEILLAGPMASDVVRVKAPKLAARDFSPQATIHVVLETNELIVQAARLAGAQSPLADRCVELYRATAAAGNAGQDMVAVLQSIESGR